jgi:hypothetical protein
VFLVNSRYPLVCATLTSSDRKGLHQEGSSFSRSYGGNLPSSLTIVLPFALVFSTRPPVSVWGTGTVSTHCWTFLGSMGSVTSPVAARHRVSELRPRLSSGPPYTLTRGLPSPRLTYPPASSFSYPPAARWDRFPKEAAPTLQLLGLTRTRWYWNINQLCIGYASRPRLSSRLTLGGIAFPRNPWAFGGGVSHPSLATHACILTRRRSTTVHTAASLQRRRSSTAPPYGEARSFGSGLEPRYIVRARSLDQ